jgi:UDP-N-acetylglucosamine diphosphorylase/glucosamine-1-phosphate N-acetyltransferase
MTRIIILASGKGTRMNSELPKVLVSLKNRPMIKYLMDSVQLAKVDSRPLLIVSPNNKDIISQALKEYNLEYIIQKEQLGTGQAVTCAQETISKESPEARNIIVLYGDHPFLKTESIQKFSQAQQTAVTIITTKLSNFDDWQHNFYNWGRIVRNDQGAVQEIIEFKDASSEEKLITEVNSGFMIFNKDWLFKNIANLENNNIQREYYLTDLIKIACGEGQTVQTINITPEEAMGINSLEELKIAENLK